MIMSHYTASLAEWLKWLVVICNQTLGPWFKPLAGGKLLFTHSQMSLSSPLIQFHSEFTRTVLGIYSEFDFDNTQNSHHLNSDWTFLGIYLDSNRNSTEFHRFRVVQSDSDRNRWVTVKYRHLLGHR